MRLLILLAIILLLINSNIVNSKKGGKKKIRFCPSSPGKKRPAILNVQASFQIAKGTAIFRVNTCRDPPVCFMATTSSSTRVENTLWQKLLDAFMGKLDVEPTFQHMKIKFQSSVAKVTKGKTLSLPISSSVLILHPTLEKLCKDAYGVYMFVPVKNLTKSRSSRIAQVQTISELMSQLARNSSTGSKPTQTHQPSRRPRAQWKKLSLEKLFINCASCSRICVQQTHKPFFKTKQFFCSTIRTKCSFRCGVLERFMKSQRIKKESSK